MHCQHASPARFSNSRLAPAISGSPVTPDDINVSGGDALAADRIIRQLEALYASRKQVVVAVVALYNLAELYIHLVHPLFDLVAQEELPRSTPLQTSLRGMSM